jgi:hypothetical protein
LSGKSGSACFGVTRAWSCSAVTCFKYDFTISSVAGFPSDSDLFHFPWRPASERMEPGFPIYESGVPYARRRAQPHDWRPRLPRYWQPFLWAGSCHQNLYYIPRNDIHQMGECQRVSFFLATRTEITRIPVLKTVFTSNKRKLDKCCCWSWSSLLSIESKSKNTESFRGEETMRRK